MISDGNIPLLLPSILAISSIFAAHSASVIEAVNSDDCVPDTAITAVKNGAYATDSLYVSKLCGICERFQLDRHDSEVADVTQVAVSTQQIDSTKLYRVGTSWKNGNCVKQIGAFTVLENAINVCKDGYKVFDWNGKEVYPNTAVTTVEKDYYRVRKSWEDSQSQIGAYEILNNAVSNCPVGYNVYDCNGALIHSSVVETVKKHPWIETVEKFNDQMKKDVKAGIPWICSNSGCKTSWSSARKNKVYRCNCAQLHCWVLREQKILASAQKFYGNKGAISWKDEETKKNVLAKCEIINFKGKKTLSELLKSHEVKGISS